MRILTATFLICVAMLSVPALAEQNSFQQPQQLTGEDQSNPYAVSGRISTLGLGVELSRTIASTGAVRLGLNGADYSFDDTTSGVDYDVELDWSSVSLMFDWHPRSQGFRLSAGVLSNANQVLALGKGSSTYDIGGQTFNASDVGTLAAKVEFNEFAPMLSLGWDNAFSDNRVGVSMGVGLVFQGTPEVALTASGVLATDPLFQQELARELADFEADVEDFELYPVASLGLSLRF